MAFASFATARHATPGTLASTQSLAAAEFLLARAFLEGVTCKRRLLGRARNRWGASGHFAFGLVRWSGGGNRRGAGIVRQRTGPPCRCSRGAVGNGDSRPTLCRVVDLDTSCDPTPHRRNGRRLPARQSCGAPASDDVVRHRARQGEAPLQSIRPRLCHARRDGAQGGKVQQEGSGEAKGEEGRPEPGTCCSEPGCGHPGSSSRGAAATARVCERNGGE